MKWILIGLLRIYRAVISPIYGPVCKYHPSCSMYALQAVTRFGAVRGSWLAVRRVIRCNPWSDGGYDPVPGTDPDAGTRPVPEAEPGSVSAPEPQDQPQPQPARSDRSRATHARMKRPAGAAPTQPTGADLREHGSHAPARPAPTRKVKP